MLLVLLSALSSASADAHQAHACNSHDDLLSMAACAADMGKWNPIQLRVPQIIIANERVTVPAFVALWLLVHIGITSLLPPDSPTRFLWANHLTAIVHCVVSLSLAVPATLSLHAFPTILGASNSDLARLTLLVSLGYFLMDLGMGTVLSIADAAVMLHHVVCVAGMAYALWTGRSGAELVTAIAIGESTIPSFSLRWMLRHAGLQETLSRLYIANEVAFFLLFLLFRVLLGLPLTVYLCTSPAVPLFIKACAVVIVAVSLLWFSHIVSRIAGLLRHRARTGVWGRVAID